MCFPFATNLLPDQISAEEKPIFFPILSQVAFIRSYSPECAAEAKDTESYIVDKFRVFLSAV